MTKMSASNTLFRKELYHVRSWYIIFSKALMSVSVRAMISVLVMEGIYELCFAGGLLQHLDSR